MADRFNNRHSQRPSSPSQPLREIFGGATMITARREEEGREDEQRFMRLLTLSDTAEAQDELTALAARGAISGEQYAAAARQILANGVKEGGTAKLPLVATNSDRLFGNLGKQYGASTEEMEFRYVMANNPDLDPNDPDAYGAARDALKAKMAAGGTIQMPAGAGEYTSQTDARYAPIRAQMAAAALGQLSNTAGVGLGGFLPGMNTITGRQPLNLTPAQAFEMEKALAKIAPEVRAEREAAARQAQMNIAL